MQAARDPLCQVLLHGQMRELLWFTPFLLPAFVLEASTVGFCPTVVQLGYSWALEVSHRWVQRQGTCTLLLHQTHAFP